MRQLARSFLLLLAWVGPAAPGGAQATGVEQEVLQLKAAGQYRDALGKSFRALEAVLDRPEPDPEAGARAEFLLALADNLTRKLPDHPAFVDLLEKLRDRPAVRRLGVLRGRIDHYLADHLFLAGRPARAAEVFDQLGYLRDFQVIGPLDNERGSGFRRRFRPEQAPAVPLDLDHELAGKKRRVGFRRIRLDDVPTRVLDLGARLRPASQVLALAAFAIRTETARDACLRLGSTGSLVVRVNGREVLRHDCQHRLLGHDQDVCSFRLRPGSNLVVVKVCTQDGSFAVRMRLTAPDGRPLPSEVEVGADRDTLLAAGRRKLEPDTAAAAAPPRIGAVAWLEKRMQSLAEQRPEAGTPEARRLGMDAFRLAYLLALRGEDDESDRRDRRWAKVATELLPDFGAAHYLYAFTLIQRGGSVADREENARMEAYRQAIRAWPRSAEAMRALAGMERGARGNLAKAETWVRKALAINPRFVYAANERLACLGRRGFAAGRTRALLDYAADPELGRAPLILRQVIDLMEKRNDLGRMLELQRVLVGQELELPAVANLARLEMRQGSAAAALATAARAVAAFPQQKRAWTLLAGLRAATGDLAGAREAWNGWVRLCPEDEKAWLALADLAARDGKRDVEIADLERALALNPNLKEERRHLEFLKARTDYFYTGLEIDAAAALAGDRGPDPDAKAKGDSHYYVFRHEIVRAYRDGTTSRYDHFLARVLNEAGANRFDTYRPPFYRGDQTARILEAKVIKPDGRVERARLGRGTWVDLPPIQAGDCVEIASRVDDRSRSFFGDYFGYVHVFPAAEPVPVRRSRLDLILEPGRSYHFQAVGDVPPPEVTRLDDGAEHRRWELTGIGRRESEERAPSLLETGPLVRVSTYGSWDEFCKWWWNLIRKQTRVTPEIRAKVRELVAGAPTLDDEVRRIYDFVVTDIRYKAWEFGVHGYKPYSVGSIFARRHGDCKDKAILMNAMLSEIGVTAYPVLIRAASRRGRDDLTLPMVEHFNHCITYIPAQKGLAARFADGTAQYHPMATIPSMDRGAKVLAVKGGHGILLDIPWTDPAENRDEVHYRVRLQANGDAIVELVHRPHLGFGPAVRERFGNEEGKRRERLADELGRTFGKVEVLDMRFSDLKDLDRPVEYSVKFAVKGFVARDGAAYRVKTAFRPELLSRLTAAPRRVHDMLLTTPSSRDVTIVYEAPPGFAWGELPAPVAFDSKVGSFRMSVERKGGRLTVHRTRSLARQRIDKADYPSLAELAGSIDRAEARELELRPSR